MGTILSQINYFFHEKRNLVHYSKCWRSNSTNKVFTLNNFQLVYIQYEYLNSSIPIFLENSERNVLNEDV